MKIEKVVLLQITGYGTQWAQQDGFHRSLGPLLLVPGEGGPELWLELSDPDLLSTSYNEKSFM